MSSINFSIWILILFLNISYGKSNPIIRSSDLDDSFKAKVITIKYEILDAFDESKINSQVEEMTFNIGNTLHIKSKHNTISNRLLFKKHDWVTKNTLLETEKRLRSEKFLADAFIFTQTVNNETTIFVKVLDQFSTSIPITIQKPNGRFIFSAGVLESNFLGYGQKIGLFYKQDLDRSSGFIEYKNTSLSPFDLLIDVKLVKSDDGFEIFTKFEKQLYSKSQKWGFKTQFNLIKKDPFIYLSGNEDSLRFKAAKGERGYIFRYPNTKTQTTFFSLIRSYGNKIKYNLSLDFKQNSTQPNISIILNSIYQSHPQSSLGIQYSPEFFKDYLLGFSLEINDYTYKSIKNYNQVKWNEDIAVGYQFKNSLYQNLGFLNARHSKLFLKHSFSWFNIYKNQIWSTQNSLDYFFTPSLHLSNNIFSNGTLTSDAQYQWRYTKLLSTYLALSWKHFFNQGLSHQITLGSESGLNAFPNRTFAGQARLLFQIEERFFPSFEIFTAIPVFAVFLNAGNTFSSSRELNLNGLHYSAGIGLRVGLTRSVQKIINHINLAIPLDRQTKVSFNNLVFSILAKTNL